VLVTLTGRADYANRFTCDIATKGKAQAQAQTDFTSTVLFWAIIILGMLVLTLLLAGQSFSKPTTEWEYLF
jgi:hypothetical protein